MKPAEVGIKGNRMNLHLGVKLWQDGGDLQVQWLSGQVAAAAAPSLQARCFTGSKLYGLCDEVNFCTGTVGPSVKQVK